MPALTMEDLTGHWDQDLKVLSSSSLQRDECSDMTSEYLLDLSQNIKTKTTVVCLLSPTEFAWSRSLYTMSTSSTGM